jgi:polysaccharide chain length determinant protein (PEP-CTERM system associated)
LEPRIEQAITLVRSAWRFRWLGLCMAIVTFIVGAAVILAIPSKYESTARVFVDNSSLIKPALEGLAVQNSAFARMEAVRRALVSRSQLEKVIDETDLKHRVRSDYDKESMLSDLANEIHLQVAGGPTQREASFFTISYRDRDPQLAYQVVRNLLNALLESSRVVGQEDAENTEKFLDAQIEEVAERLNQAEAELAEFKRRNIGVMPDNQGDYFQRIQTEMAQIDQIKSQLNVAISQRNELQARLLGGADGDGTESGRGALLTPYDDRIAEARTRLEQLLLRFTDAHPEVVAQRETLAALEARRDQELAALRNSRRSLGTLRPGEGGLVLQNLQVSLNEVEVRIATLRSELANHENRLAELRRAADTMPAIEAELAKLTRDHSTTKAQYESLLKRRESVRLAGQASAEEGEQIRVVDRPVVPLLPVFPKRPLLLVGLIAAALGIGVGTAYLASLLRPVLVNDRDFALRFPGVKIAGVVSQLATPREQAAAAWGNRAYALALMLMLVLFVSVLVAQEFLARAIERLV